MELSYSDRKAWRLVMFENETIAAITKDGLLYMFEESDIILFLEKLPKDNQGWFFNETRDRYCAERTWENRITVNPIVVNEWFGLPVLWE
jgi:hypothetical protein